ncbi:hypothetical protein BCR35DRAFT_304560 [Leucosporidium creatinivorum]|uniref:Uncharacterized protein n=1 Tax=Leucosporidium creatinivorum TaxID=106004 RepID=A0A1Y2F757_9BASI|nr:hypothetical protein BCR35DRAFT_304560 [Leucosporidium creatinivorum]
MARLAPELMPVIGTAYDSRLAFRLEITRICLSNSVWLTTVTSTPSVLVLRCMLGVEPSTPSYLCCSCTIRCTRKAGEQEWKVRQSDAQHACRLDKDPKFVRLARARGARRLEVLRQEEAEFGVQGRPFEEEVPTEDEEEDQLNSSSDEEATEVRRARPRSVAEDSAMLPATNGIAAVEDEDDDDFAVNTLEQDAIEEPAPRKKARVSLLVHPRLNEINDEIKRLARVWTGRTAQHDERDLDGIAHRTPHPRQRRRPSTRMEDLSTRKASRGRRAVERNGFHDELQAGLISRAPAARRSKPSTLSGLPESRASSRPLEHYHVGVEAQPRATTSSRDMARLAGSVVHLFGGRLHFSPAPHTFLRDQYLASTPSHQTPFLPSCTSLSLFIQPRRSLSPRSTARSSPILNSIHLPPTYTYTKSFPTQSQTLPRLHLPLFHHSRLGSAPPSRQRARFEGQARPPSLALRDGRERVHQLVGGEGSTQDRDAVTQERCVRGEAEH